MQQNRVPYPMGPPRGGVGPYGVPPPHPPPYGYPGSSYGHPHPPQPPPPHYHSHPGHQMHMGPYAVQSNFNGGPPHPPPHPGTMKSNYHHQMAYAPPYGMPSYHPPPINSMQANSYPSLNNSSSDSVSISSKSSLNSKKKRTIDGMHGGAASSNNVGGMASAYSFRRTDSNSSTTSTVTAGNNTSMETIKTEESPHKRDQSDSFLTSLNMDGMLFDDHSSTRPSRPNSRQGHPPKPQRYHRRDYSAASTASSLSVGGFSLSSYEKSANVDEPKIYDGLLKSSPKRHKKISKGSLVVDTGASVDDHQNNLLHDMDNSEHSDLEHLSIGGKLPTSTTSDSSSDNHSNLFLSLSTSPINAQADVDATPISKNTIKREEPDKKDSNRIFTQKGIRPNDTPTPPVHGELGDSEMIGDDHNTLNGHLRGQSFTPLPHISSCNDGSSISPSNVGFDSAIAPQLSWSIAGETPSLGDLAEWEEENGKLKSELKARPSSTTSTESRNMNISPHDFHLWKEEDELADRTLSGTTTPLPILFDQPIHDGSENQHSRRSADDHLQPMYTSSSSGMRSSSKHEHHHTFWSKHGSMGMPPTPMFANTEFRDDAFSGRSPMHGGDRRDSLDYVPSYAHHHGHDRIRNLRGRVHPGAHIPPMPIHIPPHMSTHLPMTSPMGLGPKAGLWSPHHGGMIGSPHHLGSPLSNMVQSKRKCVPLKPPIPSKFQGDMDKVKNAPVPEFTSLVNFPSHMSQKQSVNLPEGMRCCVMCGQACPCSTGAKCNKKCSKGPGKGSDCGLVPRSNNGQDQIGEKNNGFAIIPTQNKGLCTLCDVNVWVIVSSGLEIKWCKGCKNFRPWAAFGDKGLATKCLRCRERQREKYALQKEEKDKTRVPTKLQK